MDLWLIFLTGLTVGGLTCLAVQGGVKQSKTSYAKEEAVNHKKLRCLKQAANICISVNTVEK